jgi:transposase-like protein
VVQRAQGGEKLRQRIRILPDLPEYPDPIRTMLKTNNPIERYFQELRRRIIPMRSFNNSKSAERIIYGLIAYVLNQQQDMPKTNLHN